MKDYVMIDDNSISIDRKYFFNVFINPKFKNEENTKELSALSIRLMAFLMTELSVYHSKKLPSRKTMSTVLGVTPSSIHKSLADLEGRGFFIRSINPEQQGIVRCDEDEQVREQELYAQKIKLHIERGGFGDYFRLNESFNTILTVEEMKDILFKDIFNISGNTDSQVEVVRRLLKNLLADEGTLRNLLEK